MVVRAEQDFPGIIGSRKRGEAGQIQKDPRTPPPEIQNLTKSWGKEKTGPPALAGRGKERMMMPRELNVSRDPAWPDLLTEN